MNHLVNEIRDTSVADCYARLTVAHDYLVRAAMKAVSSMAAINGNTQWGTAAKRISVVLGAGRPIDIGEDIESHNVVEVINQVATLERLLEVLAWARMTDSGLEQFGRVVVCHPSTSCSRKSDSWENDLVLCDVDGAKARFEVSDVASSRDGNDKYRKDLASLRVLSNNGALSALASDGRLFLAVSEEFSRYIRRCSPKWNADNEVEHREVKNDGSTRVFEVVRRYSESE